MSLSLSLSQFKPNQLILVKTLIEPIGKSIWQFVRCILQVPMWSYLWCGGDNELKPFKFRRIYFDFRSKVLGHLILDHFAIDQFDLLADLVEKWRRTNMNLIECIWIKSYLFICEYGVITFIAFTNDNIFRNFIFTILSLKWSST